MEMSSSDVKIEKKKQIAPKVYIHQNNPIYDRKTKLNQSLQHKQ